MVIQNCFWKGLLVRLVIVQKSKLKNVLRDDVVHQENSSNSLASNVSSFTLVLPYSEGFKHFKHSILKNIGDVKLNVISKSHKVLNMFSNKSLTPFGLCSNLVYNFKCNGCNATYIGETARHLCTRAQEHSRLGGISNISEHNKICKVKIDISNFTILSKNFKNYWERVTCEALLIRQFKPSINVQTALATCILKVFN